MEHKSEDSPRLGDIFSVGRDSPKPRVSTKSRGVGQALLESRVWQKAGVTV